MDSGARRGRRGAGRRHGAVLGRLALAVMLAAGISFGTATDGVPRPPGANATVPPSPPPEPSASGMRTPVAEAAAADPSPWLVVALGDSVVSGGPCDCWTFPGRYGRLVRRGTGHAAAVRNLGVGGTTTADLLAALQPGTRTARSLRGADIVTVTIGANDMATPRSQWWQDRCRGCFDRAADGVRANLVKIVRLVRSDVADQPVEVLVTTYWNVFKEPATAAAADGRGSDYDEMARRATLVANSAICDAASRTAATCIDLFRPFKGDGTRDARPLLGPDRDHPDGAGHQLIADTLAAHGWRLLRDGAAAATA